MEIKTTNEIDDLHDEHFKDMDIGNDWTKEDDDFCNKKWIAVNSIRNKYDKLQHKGYSKEKAAKEIIEDILM